MPRTCRLFALFAAVSLITRGLSLAIEVIDMDEACHAAGSGVLWSGGLLYTDFVDSRPPLVYAYYGLMARPRRRPRASRCGPRRASQRRGCATP